MQSETEISLFLKQDTNKSTIAEIDQLLAKDPAIKQYHFVSKDFAWQQLQARSEGDGEVGNIIGQLDKNPLPDAFFIQAGSTEPTALEQLKNKLSDIPGVEQAILNSEWAKRLSTLLDLGKKIILFTAMLLAVVLLVIIGNTVRMQILTQKEEIEVSYLIGATKNFIRTPFLYAGVFYGLFGAMIAILLMGGIIQTFNLTIHELSELYSSDFSLKLFNGKLYLTVIISAVLIGWIGSYVAVNRAISSIAQDQHNS